MRICLLLLITLAAWTVDSGAQEAAPQDIFVRAAAVERSSQDAARLIIDVVMGRRGATHRLERWLARNAHASTGARAEALAALCAEHFRRMSYARAADQCERSVEAGMSSDESTLDLARALRDTPPIRWENRYARIELDNGHFEIDTVDGPVEGLLDTGAEIAVAMESVARRLGARSLGVRLEVGTTTTPVFGEIVVFDRLTVDGAVILNVPALMLPDAQLTMPDGDRIEFILGLPALIAAERVAYREHGRALELGTQSPRGRENSTPLYWDESGLGFAADFPGGRRGVHLDTGASRSYLFPAALSVLAPEEVAAGYSIERVIMGLGGASTENTIEYPAISLSVAGHPWRLEEIEVSEEDLNGEAARIGIGLTQEFDTIFLDFGEMRMWVR